MVAQQVLRIAAGLAAAIAVAAPARATAQERVGVVDLRTTDAEARAVSRAAIVRAIVADPRVVPIEDPALAAAMAGESHDAVPHDAGAALTEAKAAYGSLDCATAVAAALRAVDGYAALQSRGDDVTAALVQAYTYVLLCSSGAADLDRAHHTATQLRALGADPPPGVDASIWATYPPVDATTNRYIAEVLIEAPDGARVWIDHARAGVAPLTTHLAEGRHLVAVTSDGLSTAVHAAIVGRAPQTIEIPLRAAPAGRWAAVRDWVGAWRSGARPPSAYELAQLMTTATVRVLFVATTEVDTGTGRLESWAVPAGQSQAVLIGSARPDQVDELVELTVDALTRWDSGQGPASPAPVAPIAPRKRHNTAKPWWVYAAIVGAVAIGGGIVLASDLADDKQIIRLDVP